MAVFQEYIFLCEVICIIECVDYRRKLRSGGLPFSDSGQMFAVDSQLATTALIECNYEHNTEKSLPNENFYLTFSLS